MTRDEHRIVCNRDTVAAEVLDGEAIILNLATGAYYSLDKAGARVWTCIEHELAEQDIVRLIARDYGVELARVTEDVAALVTRLLEEQLVVLGAPGPAGAEPPALTGPAAYERPDLRKYSEMADMLALDPPLPGLKDLPWKGSSDQ